MQLQLFFMFPYILVEHSINLPEKAKLSSKSDYLDELNNSNGREQQTMQNCK